MTKEQSIPAGHWVRFFEVTSGVALGLGVYNEQTRMYIISCLLFVSGALALSIDIANRSNKTPGKRIK